MSLTVISGEGTITNGNHVDLIPGAGKEWNINLTIFVGAQGVLTFNGLNIATASTNSPFTVKVILSNTKTLIMGFSISGGADTCRYHYSGYERS